MRVTVFLSLLVLSFVCPISAFGEDLLLTDEYKSAYDPEAGEDRLLPGNYKKMFDPEKALRDNASRIQTPL